MITEHRVVATLRIFLALLFGILVVFQTFSLPGQFAYAEESPDQAYLRWPMTVVSVFWVLCIQVVIVSTWKLLTLVKDDRIFSDASSVWVAVLGLLMVVMRALLRQATTLRTDMQGVI